MSCRRPPPRIPRVPLACVLIGTLWLSGCATSSTLPSEGPDAGSAYTRLGVAYLEQNNLKRALNALDRALELEADNPDALQALALVYQRQGESRLAADYYQKALGADPGFTRARNNYAAFLYQQGEYRKACEQLDIASQDVQYDNRAQLFTNLGQCYIALERPEKARQSLERAGQIDPRHARSYYFLAELAFNQGDHDRAWPALQRFLRLAGPTPEALKMAAELARARGDAALAADYRQQLARMSATRP